MNAESRRRDSGVTARLLASLRDALVADILTGGVAALNHRLIAVMPPASCSSPRRIVSSVIGGFARVSSAAAGAAHWLPASTARFFLPRNHPHGGAVTAISRWSSEARATPPEPNTADPRIPAGMPAPHRSSRPKQTGGLSAISRWSGEARATPPEPNTTDPRIPAGMPATHRSSRPKQTGGFAAISRWLSEARATPPEPNTTDPRIPAGMPAAPAHHTVFPTHQTRIRP